MKFQPKTSASKRTRNRFKEHTVIPVDQFEGFSFKDGRELADNVHGFEGRTCKAFCSEERNSKDERYPRWFGWLPVDEIELVEGE
jgi:hypothetical protein